MSNWRINTRSNHPDSRHADSGWNSGWQTAESKPQRIPRRTESPWKTLFIITVVMALVAVAVRELV